MAGALLTLLKAPTLAAYTASGLWGDETIYDIAARHARATPAAFAVRDRHRRLTYPALVRADGHISRCGFHGGRVGVPTGLSAGGSRIRTAGPSPRMSRALTG